VYPLGQSYVSTGEFTFWRKVRASFIDNLYFYAMALVPGVIFFIVLFLLQGKNLCVSCLLLPDSSFSSQLYLCFVLLFFFFFAEDLPYPWP